MAYKTVAIATTTDNRGRTSYYEKQFQLNTMKRDILIIFHVFNIIVIHYFRTMYVCTSIHLSYEEKKREGELKPGGHESEQGSIQSSSLSLTAKKVVKVLLLYSPSSTKSNLAVG